MDMQSKSIKDMLIEGMSATDLLSALQEQIEEAQAEIRAEAIAKDAEYQKKQRLAEARYNLAEAMTNYMELLGVEVPTGEEREDLIKEMEQEYEKNEHILTSMGNLFSTLAGAPVKEDKTSVKKGPTPDDIIRDFLNKL